MLLLFFRFSNFTIFGPKNIWKFFGKVKIVKIPGNTFRKEFFFRIILDFIVYYDKKFFTKWRCHILYCICLTSTLTKNSTPPPTPTPLNIPVKKIFIFLFFLAEVLIWGIIFVNGLVIIHVKHIHFTPIIQKTIHPNRHRFVPNSLSL